MQAVGYGFGKLFAILALSSGMGLPLGIPPAPEDPLMAKVAPGECLFYMTWSGAAVPDPDNSNQTEKLLAEPEVQHLIGQIERLVKSALREAAGRHGPEAKAAADDAVKWAKTLLTHPAAVFVSSAKVTPAGLDIRAGAVFCAGKDAPQLKASLRRHQERFLREAAQPVKIDGETWYRIKLGPAAPVITWGVKGRYLIVGLGEGVVEDTLKRARTAPPEWLTEIRKVLPVERPATMTYLDVKALVEALAPLGGRRANVAVDALGLREVTFMASATGLDKKGFVSRTLLGLDGRPEGVLRLAAGEPLTPEDLAPIPRDATVAAAARLDGERILETLLWIARKINPEEAEDISDQLGWMQQDLGIDLLKPLGDVWCLYNSPSEGGLVATGLTAVVGVKDHARLAKTHKKLLAVTMRQGVEGFPRRSWRIERFEFAGQEVYFLNAKERSFPLAPAWCLTEKELIVALFPQNIKAYLSRGERSGSLAEVPAVAELFRSGEAPVAIWYVDTPKLFELIYPLVPMAMQAARGLWEDGIALDVSILPSACAIGRHLRPSVAAVRRSQHGIEIISRRTLPGGNIGAAAIIAPAMLLPALSSARQQARQAHSMSNLKQIGLAMHNHHDTYKCFPAAYSTDNDGKPLLSWRVQILPYLGQEALHKRFHLDQPWDSPHNKQLIALMPQVFKPADSRAGQGKTNYLTIRGKNTAFPGREKIKLADINNGPFDTIMVVEANDRSAVIWTKPDDLEYSEENPTAGLVGLRRGGFLALFCDGSVRFLGLPIDNQVLKTRLFIRNDGKVIKEPVFNQPR